MNPFKIHIIESTPEKSKPMLEQSVEAFGMLPNLHAGGVTSYARSLQNNA